MAEEKLNNFIALEKTFSPVISFYLGHLHYFGKLPSLQSVLRQASDGQHTTNLLQHTATTSNTPLLTLALAKDQFPSYNFDYFACVARSLASIVSSTECFASSHSGCYLENVLLSLNSISHITCQEALSFRPSHHFDRMKLL